MLEYTVTKCTPFCVHQYIPVVWTTCAKSVECHLHTLMCSVSVVTVVFIHTMEDDQRLNTLVREGAFRFIILKRLYQ